MSGTLRRPSDLSNGNQHDDVLDADLVRFINSRERRVMRLRDLAVLIEDDFDTRSDEGGVDFEGVAC